MSERTCMDAGGAVALSWRLAQQRNWETAGAVTRRTQPAIDPDGHALESFADGVRRYRTREQLETVGGRPAMVTYHLTKHLVEDEWQDDMFIENVARVA